MTDKTPKPEPMTMRSNCVSCGAGMEITNLPAKLPQSMPLQCDACVANKVALPKGYK